MFLTFLTVLLPRILPCMAPVNGQSYAFDDCTTVSILDTYIGIALSVFALSTLAVYLLSHKDSLNLTVTYACMAALSIMVGYHILVPRAEAASRQAPILLDSLKANYSN
ncbi:hypothetical protein A2Z33_02305 [Candidatus Gottesmanbacteria bacterium RBG_16_52_11]|uniref:Uncharacterized protein n=1 Tax=Candidatus Gottesmanbacteria bacterium RBG_16_52_11 TaxID=1798374 RepID=A0A1F5YRJ1_9BACT|nr:MAG: hypothetical protein A2Z33_02305 [Candidatus Gottesmanbacteria bacterium RBG_16_52_11]